MSNDEQIIKNYGHGELLSSIEIALGKLNKTTNTVTIEDLGPVDEFHIGSRAATDHFVKQLGFSINDKVLDVGCGLGGAARYVASKFNCSVEGIDLTDEYVQTGNTLSSWVKLIDKVHLVQGSATSMPYQNEQFNGAYMLHVGMNIENKKKLFSEVGRTLKTGGIFGIYDIMRTQEGELTFPVPWASESSISKLANLQSYKELLKESGFEIVAESNRSDFALEFFKNMMAKTKANGGPAPLGLHTLMQTSTPLKIKNMIANISNELIAPIELVARKI
jgi:ubiquinone/menaquinone biosynthesis C-methylase UbiE